MIPFFIDSFLLCFVLFFAALFPCLMVCLVWGCRSIYRASGELVSSCPLADLWPCETNIAPRLKRRVRRAPSLGCQLVPMATIQGHAAQVQMDQFRVLVCWVEIRKRFFPYSDMSQGTNNYQQTSQASESSKDACDISTSRRKFAVFSGAS